MSKFSGFIKKLVGANAEEEYKEENLEVSETEETSETGEEIKTESSEQISETAEAVETEETVEKEESAEEVKAEEESETPPAPATEETVEKKETEESSGSLADTIASVLDPEKPIQDIPIDGLILEETDKNNQIITPKRKHKEYYKGSQHEITISRMSLVIWAVIIVIVTVLISFIIADKVFFRSGYGETTYKVSFDENNNDAMVISKLQSVIQELETEFYPGVDRNQLVEGAIKGMVSELGDEYTVYYGPGTMNRYKEIINGEYEGIGLHLVSGSKGLLVQEVYAGSPSEKAGIKVNDIVVSISGVAASEITNEKLAEILSKNEEIEIELYAGEGKENKKVTVKTDTVAIQSVFEKSLGNGIYKVTITQFDSDTGEEFKNKVTDIIGKGGCKAIILDLRDNGGGYETQASMVADMILPKGTIATARDKNGKIYKEIQSEATELEVPIALLVNGNTASASELVAGAVKDYNKGKLVGTKTFGKSIGQIQITFPDDNSGLVVTIACFYTPSGNCIQGKGITPDFTVDLPEEYRDKAASSIPEENDTQLKKALSIIKEELK